MKIAVSLHDSLIELHTLILLLVFHFGHIKTLLVQKQLNVYFFLINMTLWLFILEVYDLN